MTAGTQKATIGVRVPADVYRELVRIQQEFEAAHPGGTISLGTIVGQLLAGRKPAQP